MLKSKKLKDTPTELAKTISQKAGHTKTSTQKHFKRYFSKRADRMVGVRRFTVGWLLLALGLCVTSSFAAWRLFGESRTSTPAPGGSYVEGMVGKINNLNPLFSTGAVDDASNRLMFNGILKNDTNGKLANDLAQSVKVGKDSKTYTVTLRDDVLWHDGEKLTSKDVVFTIKTIENQASRSPLYSSWQGITANVKGKFQVVFKLPSVSAPFLQLLTTPILPQHLLADVPVSSLRTARFSSSPVGTGPFEYRITRSTGNGQQLELVSNKKYFLGAPKVDRFIVQTYHDESTLSRDLGNREITAAVDLSAQAAQNIDSSKIRTVQYPIRNGVYAFFKTTALPLKDVALRRALALAINRQAVLKIFDTKYQPLKSPLLPGQLGYDSRFNQHTNLDSAVKLLNKAGWKLKNGVRIKKGRELQLKLVTLNSDEYRVMAEELQKQWSAIGVKVVPQLLSEQQLEQTALSAHEYDVLLYGVSIGADPDVFAYWHSSQATPGGLNFSEWKSQVGDLNLEAARSRLGEDLRAARYQAFSKTWSDEAPAVALYQPRMNYSYNQNAQGFKIFPLDSADDRLTNVEDWTVNTRSVYKTP